MTAGNIPTYDEARRIQRTVEDDERRPKNKLPPRGMEFRENASGDGGSGSADSGDGSCNPCTSDEVATGSVDCLGTNDSMYAYQFTWTQALIDWIADQAGVDASAITVGGDAVTAGDTYILTYDSTCTWIGDEITITC